MIKNVLPSLRQGGGPQRICSRQKSIRSGTARDSFSQTPHTRGKGLLTILTYMYFRITPACAGKSRWHIWRTGSDWDHPRTCGEKAFTVAFTSPAKGSPPHMRGKDSIMDGLQGVHGITPAHAGKSTRHPMTAPDRRNHPRACGEKNGGEQKSHCAPGSPPRVRGKELPLAPLAEKI